MIIEWIKKWRGYDTIHDWNVKTKYWTAEKNHTKGWINEKKKIFNENKLYKILKKKK